MFVIILLFGVSAGLYHVKYSVDRMERQGLALKVKIAEEQDAIRILDAEWSSLNRPERLQKLSSRYLQLAPVEVVQVVNFDQIPERSTEPVEGAGALVASAPGAAPIKSLAKTVGATPVVSMVELR
jgi:hypothetical protein